MIAHESSNLYTQASQDLLVISKQGSVVQQLWRVGMQEREKYRAAIISHVHCIHILTRHHIAHSTNFTQLVKFSCALWVKRIESFR